jgi:hypothetical protein
VGEAEPGLVKKLPAVGIPVTAAPAVIHSQDPEYDDYSGEEQYKVSPQDCTLYTLYVVLK